MSDNIEPKKRGLSFFNRMIIGIIIYLVFVVGGSFIISSVSPDDPSLMSLTLWFFSISVFIVLLDPYKTGVFGQGIHISKKQSEELSKINNQYGKIMSSVNEGVKKSSNSLRYLIVGILILTIVFYFIFVLLIPWITGMIYGKAKEELENK